MLKDDFCTPEPLGCCILGRSYRPYLKRHACRLAFVCAGEGAMPDAPSAKFGLHLKPAVRRAALKHIFQLSFLFHLCYHKLQEAVRRPSRSAISAARATRSLPAWAAKCVSVCWVQPPSPALRPASRPRPCPPCGRFGRCARTGDGRGGRSRLAHSDGCQPGGPPSDDTQPTRP